MNAAELFLKNLKEGNIHYQSADVWYCDTCRHVHKTQEAAEKCCRNYKCSVCGCDTGARHYTACQPCMRKDGERRERERFDKAEKLTTWAGAVYEHGEYYPDLDTFLSCVDERPDYVWACIERPLVHADEDDITSRIFDEAYEGFEPDDLKGLDELRAAIKVFNEANAGLKLYHVDYTKAVLIPKLVEEEDV